MDTHHNPSDYGGDLLSEYLTPEQCAEQLGICRRTLERWHRLNEGPPRVRLGKRWLYRKSAVADWLRSMEEDAA